MSSSRLKKQNHKFVSVSFSNAIVKFLTLQAKKYFNTTRTVWFTSTPVFLHQIFINLIEDGYAWIVYIYFRH